MQADPQGFAALIAWLKGLFERKSRARNKLVVEYFEYRIAGQHVQDSAGSEQGKGLALAQGQQPCDVVDIGVSEQNRGNRSVAAP